MNEIQLHMSEIHKSANTKQYALQAVQVRIAGAKGMLFLDTKLQGRKVVLRESMMKFFPGYYRPLCSNQFFIDPLNLTIDVRVCFKFRSSDNFLDFTAKKFFGYNIANGVFV